MRGAIEAHLGTRQVARVIYGAIIGLALVVGLEAHPPGAGAMIATLLGTAVAVGLAELYSEVVGTETRTHRRVGRRQLSELRGDVAAVAFGIAFPAVFFVLAAGGRDGGRDGVHGREVDRPRPDRVLRVLRRPAVGRHDRHARSCTRAPWRSSERS